MKKYKAFLMLLVGCSIVGLTSCDKETEGVSKVTTYPTLKLKGSNPYISKLNTPYVDPGISAMVNGKEATVTIKNEVKGMFQSYSGDKVNSDLANKYLVNYTVLNEDGFPLTLSRDVYVAKTGDLTTSIEGLYTANVVRTPAQGVVPADKDLNYLVIWKNGDGTYGISDAIGGYYAIGRAYGDTYLGSGLTITANNIATNSFTFGTGAVVGTFGGAVTVTSLTVDAVNKQLVLTTTWSTYGFKITLKQVNL
jgi:hypothetical protein